jgi:glycosyltransferase 2 family protein
MHKLWRYLRVLAGVGILAALAVRLGTAAVVDGLRSIGPGAVLAALGIGLLTTVFSAWRWCLVVRGLGMRLPLATAVADCYRAVFLNSVLPAGVLGDVHRAVSHGRQSGDVGRGVRAVVLERSAGQVVLLVVGAGVLLAQPTLLAAVVERMAPGFGLVAGLLAALAVVVVLGVCAARVPRIRAALRTARADTRAGLLSRGTLPGVLLLSAAALAGYLVLFVVAARVAGSEATIGQLLPLLMVALLAMALPLNIGGWGPREAVSAVAFGAVGFTAAQGLTVAVVYGVLSLIACLPGVGVLLLRDPISRRLRQRAEVTPAAPAGDTCAEKDVLPTNVAGVLILVRHGQTEANARGLLLGRADPPLNESGYRQAQALAEALPRASRIVSSPLRRARDTAAVLAGTGPGAMDAGDVEVDARWIEMDYGDLDGRPATALDERSWWTWRQDPDFVPAGGESLADVCTRVHEACAELADDAASGDVVVVSHVSPIKAAVTWALGVGDEVGWRMFLGDAAICRIDTSGRVPLLLAFNDPCPLDKSVRAER